MPARRDTRACSRCLSVHPAEAFEPRGRLCPDCRREPRASRVRPRVCRRCGEVRAAGEYRPRAVVCEACRAAAGVLADGRTAAPRPCMDCHRVKPAAAFGYVPPAKRRGSGHHQRRRGVCLDCEARRAREKAERAARNANRRVTFELDGVTVRRCSKCREVKPLTDGFTVTNPARTGVARYHYHCRACTNARVEAYRQRVTADPERAARRRAQRAAAQRRWRAKNPDRASAASRRYRDRLKADRGRYARHLEAGRMSYRLRRERRDGVPADTLATFTPKVTPAARAGGPRTVPALPLHHAVERAIALHVGALGEHDGEVRAGVCERAGVTPRDVFAWGPRGEREDVTLTVAERVLTRLGLLWWEVWTPDDPAAHRAAARVFEGDDAQVAA